MRRNAAEGGEGPVNMDDSDDPEDAEIYASLRRRLEELEKSAPVDSGNGVQPASTMAETCVRLDCVDSHRCSFHVYQYRR